MLVIVLIYCTYIISLAVISKTIAVMDIKPYLHSYDHRESRTQCLDDLLLNDSFVLHGEITYRNISEKMVVQLEMYDKNSNTTVENIELKQCTGLGSQRFSCQKSGNDIINTLFNTIARKPYSKASMQLVVYVLDKKVSSQAVDLPVIYDPSKIEMTLNLIEEKISHERPDAIVYDGEKDEIVACCINAPRPCVAVISDSSSTILNESDTCVTYRHIAKHTMEYKIGYKVCKQEYLPRFTLIMKSDYQINIYGDKIESDSNWNLLGLLFLLIPIGIAISVVAYLKKNKKCCFEHSANNNNTVPLKPENGETHEIKSFI